MFFHIFSHSYNLPTSYKNYLKTVDGKGHILLLYEYRYYYFFRLEYEWGIYVSNIFLGKRKINLSKNIVIITLNCIKLSYYILDSIIAS